MRPQPPSVDRPRSSTAATADIAGHSVGGPKPLAAGASKALARTTAALAQQPKTVKRPPAWNAAVNAQFLSNRCCRQELESNAESKVFRPQSLIYPQEGKTEQQF